MTLHSLMGQKSLAVFGDLVLGIRLIKVWLYLVELFLSLGQTR